MKIWIGALLFLAGGIIGLLGYAPFFSPRATSLPMILVGGSMLAAGTFVMLFKSAKAMDTRELDDIDLIRP